MHDENNFHSALQVKITLRNLRYVCLVVRWRLCSCYVLVVAGPVCYVPSELLLLALSGYLFLRF